MRRSRETATVEITRCGNKPHQPGDRSLLGGGCTGRHAGATRARRSKLVVAGAPAATAGEVQTARQGSRGDRRPHHHRFRPPAAPRSVCRPFQYAYLRATHLGLRSMSKKNGALVRWRPIGAAIALGRPQIGRCCPLPSPPSRLSGRIPGRALSLTHVGREPLFVRVTRVQARSRGDAAWAGGGTCRAWRAWLAVSVRAARRWGRRRRRREADGAGAADTPHAPRWRAGGRHGGLDVSPAPRQHSRDDGWRSVRAEGGVPSPAPWPAAPAHRRGRWRLAADGGGNRQPRGHPTAAAPASPSAIASRPPSALSSSLPRCRALHHLPQRHRPSGLPARGGMVDDGADDPRQGPFACPPAGQPPRHRWSARGVGGRAPCRARPPSPCPKQSPRRGLGVSPRAALLAACPVHGGAHTAPRGHVGVAAAARWQQGQGYVAGVSLVPIKRARAVWSDDIIRPSHLSLAGSQLVIPHHPSCHSHLPLVYPANPRRRVDPPSPHHDALHAGDAGACGRYSGGQPRGPGRRGGAADAVVPHRGERGCDRHCLAAQGGDAPGRQ